MTTDVELLTGNVLKTGDTAPNLTVKLLEDGYSKNLSNFSTVTIMIRDAKDEDILVDDNMTIIDNDNGIVEYDWSTSDTSNSNYYEAEITIDDGSGTIITFPNFTTFQIEILEKIN